VKIRNALTDDAGVEWEFRYDETTSYEQVDGAWVAQLPQVTEFRYRRKGEEEWLVLPPWADVEESRKITLCLFDEDEETGELTFWPVAS
jgi:hypothetical protein